MITINKALKIILIILLVLVLLVGILAGSAYFFIKGKLNKINYVEINKDNLSITEKAKDSLSKYRNILILGVDSRNIDTTKIDETGNNRSDCIMIASINKETNEVKLMSLYRDTYLNLDGEKYENLNEAYSMGGPELTIAAVNRNFDLNITEFVSANFYSIATLVDQLGGINIDITKDELKFINSYIKDVKKLTGMSANNITKTGPQKLNGVQAVSYARIRYDAGEIKRTERMRTVLEKCFEKLKEKDVIELNSIADTMLPKVSTNIDSKEIFDMIPEIAKYNIKTVETHPKKLINTQGKFDDGGRWHQFPCTLETNVIEIHKVLFPDVEYVVSDTVKSISEYIKEVSGYDESSI